MGLESIVGEAGKALLKSESVSKLGAEFFKKDAEVLAGLGGLKAPELTKKVTEHLIKEGRPGSAEYMGVFSKSVVLNKELEMIESGIFDAKKTELLGLPVMIDVQQTTLEMIRSGQAVLTQEARADFLGSINSLKYKLDQHIGKTAQEASEYYSTELTSEKTIAERLRGILGIKSEPYEIPFTPNEAELERLEGLSGLKFTSREEAQQLFQRELQHMMRQRPRVVGLETSASASRFLEKVAKSLGGNAEGTVDINRLRHLHDYMKGQGMEELQIYPEFGTAIENSIDRDLAEVNT